MRHQPPPIVRKDTFDIIAESRADLRRAAATQVALRSAIAATRAELGDAKDLLRQIEAVLAKLNGKS